MAIETQAAASSAMDLRNEMGQICCSLWEEPMQSKSAETTSRKGRKASRARRNLRNINTREERGRECVPSDLEALTY
jgi:hypothetical protein